MVAMVVVVIDEGADLSFNVSGQVVVYPDPDPRCREISIVSPEKTKIPLVRFPCLKRERRRKFENSFWRKANE